MASEGSSIRRRLSTQSWVTRIPTDISAAFWFSFISLCVVFLPYVRETPLRVVFVFVYVLFVPGYLFIASLFPRAARSDRAVEGQTGISVLERVALSIGSSVALVGLIGVALTYTVWGLSTVSIATAVSLLVVVLLYAATRRRLSLKESRRFELPLRAWYEIVRRSIRSHETKLDYALTVLTVVAVLGAVASAGYAVTGPRAGSTFTEFYLLTEDSSGELTASDYPTEFTRGEPQELVVGITNQEHEPVSYTVIVQLQRVTPTGDSSTVLEVERLNRFETRLDHDETWRQSHQVTPAIAGTRLRLTYLLYRGSPPSNPTIDNAYRETHLWINASV
jgi:uncharacterized membrane protein